jgi:glycosyltransferase involved in cell wall biosynthesis
VKILLIHNEYRQPGGEEVVVEQERQLLQQAGHQVVHYRRSNVETEGISGLGQLSLVKKIVWASDARQDVALLLRNQKPQIVHVHNTFMVISPSIYSACREAGVPVVQTLHNFRLFCPAAFFYRDGHVCEDCSDHSLWRGIQHACYRQSRPTTAAVALMLEFHRLRHTWEQGIDTFIALNEFARNKFISLGLPAEKVCVKPNFLYSDPGKRTEPGQYAMFAGRLSPEKGVSTLLSAWARLKTRIPLRIIGDGPLLPTLQAEAAKRGLSDVHFEGRLNREQTLAAFKGASFMLFPSLWYENFPMVIAEAFACSTPVIGSRLGALEVIVQDGHTGLHFAPGDPADLATKVEWAWNHPEKVQVMGSNARQEFETKYTAEKNYTLLMEIYERAIRRRTPEPTPLSDEAPTHPETVS